MEEGKVIYVSKSGKQHIANYLGENQHSTGHIVTFEENGKNFKVEAASLDQIFAVSSNDLNLAFDQAAAYKLENAIAQLDSSISEYVSDLLILKSIAA